VGVSVFLAGFRSLFCGFDRIFTGYLGHGEPLTQWISHDSMVRNCQEFFRALAYIEGNSTRKGILRTLSNFVRARSLEIVYANGISFGQIHFYLLLPFNVLIDPFCKMVTGALTDKRFILGNSQKISPHIPPESIKNLKLMTPTGIILHIGT
jgi:hypothetical protein